MSEILDNIVNCSISIESPVEDGSSFGAIMLVGNPPTIIGENFKSVDKYADLSEITEAGWDENSDMYKAARAAFMQKPKTEFIYIAMRKNLSETNENADTADTNEAEKTASGKSSSLKLNSDMERFSETVKRVISISGWYGLALVGAENADFDEVAALIESTEKILAISTDSKENPLQRNDYLRTFVVYSEIPEEYIHIALMAACFSFDPGRETWAYKTLSGITPSELTSHEMNIFNDQNMNYYVSCANKNISMNGKVIGGEWIDIIRFRDWLNNQMQIKIFELFIKNPKIPYLDSGIALVENQMREVLQKGQEVGGVAETEYDENDEPVYGYTVTVPKAASLSSAQRKGRKLVGCRFTARLAGAIHVVELRGNLVF